MTDATFKRSAVNLMYIVLLWMGALTLMYVGDWFMGR